MVTQKLSLESGTSSNSHGYKSIIGIPLLNFQNCQKFQCSDDRKMKVKLPAQLKNYDRSVLELCCQRMPP